MPGDAAVHDVIDGISLCRGISGLDIIGRVFRCDTRQSLSLCRKSLPGELRGARRHRRSLLRHRRSLLRRAAGRRLARRHRRSLFVVLRIVAGCVVFGGDSRCAVRCHWV